MSFFFTQISFKPNMYRVLIERSSFLSLGENKIKVGISIKKLVLHKVASNINVEGGEANMCWMCLARPTFVSKDF